MRGLSQACGTHGSRWGGRRQRWSQLAGGVFPIKDQRHRDQGPLHRVPVDSKLNEHKNQTVQDEGEDEGKAEDTAYGSTLF